MDDSSIRPTDTVADDLMQVLLDDNPLGGSLFGIPGREDQLTNYTVAGDESELARLRDIAGRAAAIDPASLSATDLVTRSVVLHLAEAARCRLTARGVEYTVTDSVFTSAIDMLRMLPLVSITAPADAKGYLSRLRQVPQALEAIAQRHRIGIAAGRLPVTRLAEAAVASLDRLLDKPDDDPLRRPQPPGESKSFTEERDQLLAETVRPAVRRYREMLRQEVVPHGRPDERPGLCHLPDGESFYGGLVWIHTGATGQTPEALHATGLAVLEELTDAFKQLASRQFGSSDVATIAGRLHSDPALRWRDGNEALACARAALHRAEQAAPAWFPSLPEQRCVVSASPDGGTGSARAFYLPPTLDGRRPGNYLLNIDRSPQPCRFNGEALAFFGAVPGQHLLFASALERTDLPLIRRVGPFGAAYQAGWGLYAVELADEMHLYSDDLARLGMLSEAVTRAARLVADTGLHAHGWSRQRVVDFLRARTFMPDVEVEAEADQYVAAPGQALASMIGRLEIRRLRSAAERELGERYDVKEFHGIVLGSGSLPLSVLGEVVDAWLAERTATLP